MGMPLVVPECLPDRYLEAHPVIQSTDENGVCLDGAVARFGQAKRSDRRSATRSRDRGILCIIDNKEG